LARGNKKKVHDYSHLDLEPGKYSPDLIPKLKEHFENGYSFRSFAAVAKIPFSTLFRWINQYPEFANAKKMYEPLGLAWLETMGKQALMLPDGVKFSSAVWFFMMQNRYHEVDISKLDQDKVVNPARLSKEELQQIIDAAEESLEQLKSMNAEKHELIETEAKQIEDKSSSNN